MRLLILGGDGMLGHQLYRQLRAAHEIRVTLRARRDAYGEHRLWQDSEAYFDIDARDAHKVEDVLADFRPDVVVNAVGIVKQRPTARESIPSIEINALFPHRLALICGSVGARLIHFSTDCVFSGRSGHYDENSPPDPDDLYGRTKLLGEVQEHPCVTLRTSIIGPELGRKSGLLEWFLAQRGRVRGYRHAIFSGFTTLEMGRIVERLAAAHGGARGLYHVASEPISKYDLLLLINEKMKLGVEVVPDDAVKCNRSLDGSRFRAEFHYTPPSWAHMIEELAASLGRAPS